MNNGTVLGGLALVLAVAALALGWMAYSQAQDAQETNDNLVESLQTLAPGIVDDEGAVDESALQPQQPQQPSEEEMEEMEEQQPQE